MYLILILSIVILLISNIMMMLCNILSKKTFYDREKNSPFECGFDPKNSARLPFSLHFFLISMIFLIFDVEITLLLPLINLIKISNMVNFISLTLIFILILIFGILHEWSQGALNWI